MRKATWTAFGGDEGGNFAVTFAVASTLLVSAAGFAVDTANLFRVRTALQGALDAAVTSTARDLTTGKVAEKDARAAVERFLSTNGVGTLGADRAKLESLVVDRSAKTVEASARIAVDLFFPFLDEDGRAEVAVGSAALYSDKKIEVAMMLDVTGSMGGQKIKDLRTAATVAVNEFLGSQDPKEPRVRVAIVPYAEAVNVGALAPLAVFAEKDGGPNLPPPTDEAVKVSGGWPPDNCATERKLKDGTADASDDGPLTERDHAKKNKTYLAKVNRDDRLDTCPVAELVPLTADKDKLLASIKDFKANGVTAGGIAAQWGYYMLSPEWRDTISQVDKRAAPAGYGDKVAKVAILMTDGEFNTAFAGIPESNRDPQGDYPARSRGNAEAVCAAMKKDGVQVFTIGFALPADEKGEARKVLKTCASPDTGGLRHFFDVSTGPELVETFRAIIRNVEALTVTH